MQNIKFEDGKRQFTINGDKNKVIEFDPCDEAIVERFRTVSEQIAQKAKDPGDEPKTMDERIKSQKELDTFVRDRIDYIFNAKVADTVFGNTSSLSVAGGVPFYERFLTAVLPIIEKAVKDERQKTQAHLEKYVGKYIKK